MNQLVLVTSYKVLILCYSILNVTVFFFHSSIGNMNFLSKKIVESMQIPDEDKELYEYGVIVFLKKLLFYIIIFCLMLILRQGLEGMCFLLAFSYTRRNAGGLHCKTFVKCFLLSISSILISVILIKYEVFAILYYRYAIIFSEALLILMRPVDCENKRVLEEEKEYFYKQEKIVLIIINIVIVIFAFCGFSNIEKSIESAVILVAVTSVIAFFSQKNSVVE